MSLRVNLKVGVMFCFEDSIVGLKAVPKFLTWSLWRTSLKGEEGILCNRWQARLFHYSFPFIMHLKMIILIKYFKLIYAHCSMEISINILLLKLN